MDTSGDPYARPSDRLGEVEKRILAAAFAASSLVASEMGVQIPLVVGRPVLLSSNDKSDVLVVTFQCAGVPSIITGLIGSSPSLFAGSARRVVVRPIDAPQQQILLAGEQLWFVPETIVGLSAFVVCEVTP